MSTHTPISPYKIPMHDIVSLHPATHMLWPVYTDIYVGRNFMQVQVFHRDQLRKAFNFTFTHKPVSVNLMDFDNGQVLYTLAPTLKD